MEEKLVVLDEFGNPTGETIERAQAHKNGILHGASHLYIYRQNSNKGIDILLQRRSNTKDSFPGCLDISSAGHMVEGMDFESTAIKELAEELGIKIDASQLDYAFTQRIAQRSIFGGEDFIDQEINKIYLLNRNVDISTLELQKEEVSEVVWMSEEEIAKRLETGDKGICLNKEEFNGVINIIKRKLQENEKNKLSYLQVKVSPIPTLSEQKTDKTFTEDERE